MNRKTVSPLLRPVASMRVPINDESSPKTGDVFLTAH